MKKPFDKVELEIIRSDIAFLKEQEKKSGDRRRWLANQRRFFGSNWKMTNRELLRHENSFCNPTEVNRYEEYLYGPDPRVNKK
jgi:hypothetical protein